MDSDSLDKALCRAHEIFLEDLDDEKPGELDALLPPLIEAGYVSEEPWGEDYEDSEGWSLWRFTEAGVRRAEELGCL